ncbi:hypothetical protein L3V83_00580 [Thiotrichales bacterium 19X7-9]|nr:hypothetical protein [Thiotrichales bacterium 19X7-9]
MNQSIKLISASIITALSSTVSHKKKHFLGLCAVVISSNSYANNSTPQPIFCIDSDIQINQPDVVDYYKSVNIVFTNHCGKSENLKNAIVRFNSNSQVNSVWGDWKFVNSDSNPPNYENGQISFIIAKNTDAQLNNNESFKVSFGLNFAHKDLAKVSEAQIYTNNQPITENGKIQLTFKANPTLKGNSTVTLKQDGKIIRQYSNDNWSKDQIVSSDHLAYGLYNLSATDIDQCKAIFTPTNALNINTNQINYITVNYQCQPQDNGQIDVTLPNAPINKAASNTMVKLMKNNQTISEQSLNWNSSYQFKSLSYGDYTIEFQKLSDGKHLAAAKNIDINLTKNHNSISATPAYQISTLSTVSVPFAVNSDVDSDLTLNLVDSTYGADFSLPYQINTGETQQVVDLPQNDSFNISINSSKGNATIDKQQFNTSTGTQPTAFHINIVQSQQNYGNVIYHTNFPVNPHSTTVEKIDLSQPKYVNLILSNYVAGELLSYMISDKYPSWHYNHDYVVGSLFGQLLQENISTASYPGDNFINNEEQRNQLLQPGQGGPYQLNDYSKRLPGVDTKGSGSEGLINYKVLQASLGYTIEEQDNGSQTLAKGPVSLDNIYFGPIAAAYFHLNDINRINVNNLQTWGPQANSWPKCKIALDQGKFESFDMILNAAYNAGTYSDILGTLIDLCAYPDELNSYMTNLSNYSMNDEPYINAFQLPSVLKDGYHPKSLPNWYNETTFVIYPRQVEYYIDQLTNNNSKLEQYGLTTNTSFAFNLEQLKDVFENSMHTLAYGTVGNYQFISKQDSAKAFDTATTKQGLLPTTIINLNNANDRAIMYQLISNAFSNLEQTLNFNFDEITETNFIQ